MHLDIDSITGDIAKIVEAMKRIETVSDQSAEDMAQVLTESEDQAAAIKEITSLIENLSKMAETLDKQTHQFKLQ